MDNLTQAIMQYITMRTDYAIMLTGEWGSGKTFYVNNVLKKEIEKHKDYIPIVISLFGVSSIEEVSTKILLETVPFFSKIKLKNWSPFAKVILRGVMSGGRLGDIDKYIDDLRGIPERLAKYERSIIIFDDFERKGEISISELTGYINALVEDESSKVVIVANENEVSELKSNTDENVLSDYHALKEKIVRSTFPFDLDFSKSLQEIIEVKYSSAFPIYRSFLDDHIELIARRFVKEANSKNLRTLSFALEIFQYVFSSIHNYNESKKEYDEIQLEKYLREMFLFTLAVCIEYRRGEFQKGDPNGIDSEKRRLIYLGERAGRPEEKTKKDFDTLFIERYFKNGNVLYFFFRSLFDFIVGKAPFQIDKAIAEIDKLAEMDTEKPEWQIYYRARSRDHFRLSNSAFEHFYHELLSYAERGLYPLYDMLNVSSYLEQMAKILDRDLDDLQQRLKKGTQALFERFEEDDPVHIDDPKENTDVVVRAVIEFSNELGEKIKTKGQKNKIDAFNRLMTQDFEKFVEEMQNENLAYKPVFNYIDVDDFRSVFDKIVKSRDNNLISKFWSLVNYRYRNSANNHAEDERGFFEEFRNILASYTLDEKTLTAELIKIMSELVGTILKA